MTVGTITSVIHSSGLVILDCDGVLVDSEPIAIRVSHDMLAELDWHLTDDEIVDLFVGRSPASNTVTIEAHIGRRLPHGWLDEFNRRIRAGHDNALALVPGVIEALAGIDALGFATCVATSGSHDKTRHSLTHVGLYERFAGRIFSASDVTHGKPAPDLFLHAATTLGVAPAACVVVEDSRYGIEAARAAGMRAIGYAGGVTPAHWLAGPGTTVITDMRNLPGLLAEAFADSR